MDLARRAIDRPVPIWLLMLFCVFGGLWGIDTVGRLEDPAFTIKEAIVLTPYPGATAAEVEREVTEPLEAAIQRLPQLRRITSRSMPGLSHIQVEIQNTYSTRQLPQVWDELRRRVTDHQPHLPAGAGPSAVNDDFGDVFGLFYAVMAPDLPAAERHDLARFLQRELVRIPGVTRVDLAGEEEEAIHVDVAQDRLVSLGIPLEHLLATLDAENRVTDAGSMRIGDRRIRLDIPPAYDSVGALSALRIGRVGTTEQVRLDEIATLRRQPVEQPGHLIRFDGVPAFTVAVAVDSRANIVAVGAAVDRRLAEVRAQLPLGVSIAPIYEQHRVVDAAIDSFLVSLSLAVAIVIGVLWLFMGWRVSLVVGSTLFLTVMGTLFFMGAFGIEMERISLGALVIAMGMLVDNAIVVAEGMLINMQRGRPAADAASEAARRTGLPLLGATVIGIMAFAGIGLSPDETGEFLFSLFLVIGISLLLSWLLALTATPLLGQLILRPPTAGRTETPYRAPLYRAYRAGLAIALRHRWGAVALLAAITGASFHGFGSVSQGFFPDSMTPLLFVKYQLPQGSDIRATERDAIAIEAFVRDMEDVESVATFIGGGATRFNLTYNPEHPDPAYAEFVVRTAHADVLEALAARLRADLGARYPQARIRIDRPVFGPPAEARVEARFVGPDSAVLRRLGSETKALMRETGALVDIRHDWREQEALIVPRFDEAGARMAGIGRDDLGTLVRFATEGIVTGTYRERDRQIPIVLRPPDPERLNPERLGDRLLWSPASGRFVPLEQVVSGFDLVTADTRIQRRDRARTLTVQAEPAAGHTAHAAMMQVRPTLDAMSLPRGYRLEWGGEYEDAAEAQTSLARQLPISMLIILVISVLLFPSWRQPLILWLIVPMSVCGVVVALLATNLPFTFVASLGFLSLSGMLMKNAIVLIDEIDRQIAEGKRPDRALTDASVSRLRPVTLAAATTILGMTPLVADAFFASMAVTIMGGLAFATLLTLIAVPVFYALLFRIRPETPSP